MGGDKGPRTTIEGIYKASKIFPKVHFRLFGDKQKVFDELILVFGTQVVQ